MARAKDSPQPTDRLLAALPKKQRRGSRARCILLTHGPDEAVARRLSALVAPYAYVDPARHRWMPCGFAEPAEAKLGDTSFFSQNHRDAITSWWLAVPKGANTPNWDIASTAMIGGSEGLVLIEAKAHAAEIRAEGKTRGGHAENHAHIDLACRGTSTALNNIRPQWALSAERHYQLSNRFAWSWKLASLGIPVVFVYLGFIGAGEMLDQGPPIADADQWQRLARGHSCGIVPEWIWDEPLMVGDTPFRALIRSMEVSFDRVL